MGLHPVGEFRARWGRRREELAEKINIFEKTSMALYAYFRLMELLGLPRKVTSILPPEAGSKEPKVVVSSRLPEQPVVGAIFCYVRDSSVTRKSWRLIHVTVFVTVYGTFVGPVTHDGVGWRGEFGIEYPNDPEVPEFIPPAHASYEGFLHLPLQERREAILKYFREGLDLTER